MPLRRRTHLEQDVSADSSTPSEPDGGSGGTYGLLLAFDRDGEDFRDGFEMGRMWALAQERDEEFTEQVHICNAEMLLRIAEATHRPISWEETADGWADVTFWEAQDDL